MAWAIGIGAVALSVRTFLLNVPNSDFASFYESAAAWRIGASPYVPVSRLNLNPPVLLWVFEPFSRWPLDVAARLWIGFQLLALWIVIDLAAAGTSTHGRRGVLVRGLILLALAPLVPFVQLLREGQWILWLAVIVTAAWRSDRAGRPYMAAVLLGAAIAVKPFLWWFWLAQSARFRPAVLAAGAAGFAATTLASWLTGPDLLRDWMALGRELTLPHLTHWLNLSLPAHLTRTLGWSWRTGTLLVTIVLLPLFFDWRTTIRGWRATAAPVTGIGALRASGTTDAMWWLASLATVLAAPLGWSYYVVLGSGPAVACVAARGELVPILRAAWVGLHTIWISAVPLTWATWIWTAGLACCVIEALRSRSSPTEGSGSEDPAHI
jgi:hypothetical protein